MATERFGIRETELNSLSVSILDYADRLMELFEKLDTTIDDLPKYYKDEACDILMNKYHDLSEYYSVIKNNFVSYSDDLMALIKHTKENYNYYGDVIDIFTEDTKKEKAKIEMEWV
mgnify:FL=1